MSYQEDLFVEKLKKLLGNRIAIERNIRPYFMINPLTGKPLELDVYLPKFNVGFEYQGNQHFMQTNIPNDIDYQKQKDLMKYELVNKKEVFLVEIFPEDIKSRNFRSILLKRLITIWQLYNRNYHKKPKILALIYFIENKIIPDYKFKIMTDSFGEEITIINEDTNETETIINTTPEYIQGCYFQSVKEKLIRKISRASNRNNMIRLKYYDISFLPDELLNHIENNRFILPWKSNWEFIQPVDYYKKLCNQEKKLKYQISLIYDYMNKGI